MKSHGDLLTTKLVNMNGRLFFLKSLYHINTTMLLLMVVIEVAPDQSPRTRPPFLRCRWHAFLSRGIEPFQQGCLRINAPSILDHLQRHSNIMIDRLTTDHNNIINLHTSLRTSKETSEPIPKAFSTAYEAQESLGHVLLVALRIMDDRPSTKLNYSRTLIFSYVITNMTYISDRSLKLSVTIIR